MNDRAFKKELNVLKINCMYRTEKQCPWAGYLAEYQVCFIYLNFITSSY